MTSRYFQFKILNLIFISKQFGVHFGCYTNMLYNLAPTGTSSTETVKNAKDMRLQNMAAAHQHQTRYAYVLAHKQFLTRDKSSVTESTVAWLRVLDNVIANIAYLAVLELLI